MCWFRRWVQPGRIPTRNDVADEYIGADEYIDR
jgi:hypothetical protein